MFELVSKVTEVLQEHNQPHESQGEEDSEQVSPFPFFAAVFFSFFFNPTLECCKCQEEEGDGST